MRTDALYSQVTNTIIKQLEAGVIPWTQPWQITKDAAYVPTNVATGRLYNGINTLILWAAAMENGYRSHGWMTFHQAKQLGGNVRRGEKATQILFIKRTDEIDEQTGKAYQKVIPKAWSVFHVDQLENLPETYQGKDEGLPETTRYQEALRVFRECGIRIKPSSRAAYIPKLDVVEMPPPSTFLSEEEYFGIAFHELVHATGHPSRLDRKLSVRFKSDAYAFEELVAELGSAFICARVGIPARHRSAAYVEHWLRVMKSDNKALFDAASMSAKAANYVCEQSHAIQEDTPDVERRVEQIAVAI